MVNKVGKFVAAKSSLACLSSRLFIEDIAAACATFVDRSLAPLAKLRQNGYPRRNSCRTIVLVACFSSEMPFTLV